VWEQARQIDSLLDDWARLECPVNANSSVCPQAAEQVEASTGLDGGTPPVVLLGEGGSGRKRKRKTGKKKTADEMKKDFLKSLRTERHYGGEFETTNELTKHETIALDSIRKAKLNNTQSSIMLKGFQKTDADVTMADSRKLMGTPKTTSTHPVAPGQYSHLGLAWGIVGELNKVAIASIPEVIEIIINIDGLPLAKSSGSQFWPVLGKIKGLAGTGVFPIGIWFHTQGKPDCANDLLSFFVAEALYLYENKLEYREQLFPSRLLRR